MRTRVVREKGKGGGIWIFGPYTQNPLGDFRMPDWQPGQVVPAAFTIEYLLTQFDCYEDPNFTLDPDYDVDEGL